MKINKKYIIYVSIIVVLLGGFIVVNSLNNTNDEIVNNIALLDEDITTTIEIDDNYFYVDVKGEVKNPGVYKVKEGMIVNDVISLAGGLTKNAYTKNINLASKVTDGTVIYIYKKSEVTTKTSTTVTTTNSYTIPITSSSDDDNNKLININTASKEELLTIPGIGESKAVQIIEYRKTNPFITIEDIMNVSGIGESLYAKIKEYITV